MTFAKTLPDATQKAESDKRSKSKPVGSDPVQDAECTSDQNDCKNGAHEDCECYPKEPRQPSKLFQDTLDF